MPDDKLTAIADTSVDDPSDDLLGHTHLARVLLEYVRVPVSGVQTIGLIGAWGSGKSSIKNLAKNELEDKSDVRIVEFNAWRHGGDDVQRAFFRELYLEMGGDQQALNDALFSAVESTRNRSNISWKKIWSAVVVPSGKLFVIWFVLAGVVFAALYGLLHWQLPAKSSYPAILALAYGLTLLLPVAFSLYKFVVNPRRLTPLLQEKVTIRQGPISAAEQYETRLLNQLEETCDESEHVIVFVDDIDRLRSEPAIAAIEAIRTFLDMPQARLESLPHMTFVISLDEIRLGATLEAELSGRDEARDYVTRLFQLRVEVPPAPTRDLRSFGKTLLERDPNVLASLDDADITNAVLDRLVTDEVRTPREVVRLVNRFVQMFWLARQRESDNLDEAGLISPGRVTKNLECLAAAVALAERFPNFTREVVQHPRNLHAASKYAMSGDAELPETLEKMVQEKKQLNRYLASLYGLHWPEYELTFFRLAEDAFSREFGDRANELRKAMVANDVDSARKQLSVQNKASKMTYENVQLLQDVLRGLKTETGVRGENAARTTIMMLHQIDGSARTPVCQAILPIWSTFRELRHSIELLPALEAFLEVSDELAAQLLMPVLRDFADGQDIETERSLENVKGEVTDWASAAIRLSVRSNPLRPLVSRFVTNPELIVNGDAHSFRWEEVLSWFPAQKDELDVFLGEFARIFRSAAEESGANELDWHKFSVACAIADEDVAPELASSLRYASSEHLAQLIPQATDWRLQLRERIVGQANELAARDELRTDVLERLSENLSTLEECNLSEMHALVLQVATEHDILPALFEQVVRRSNNFPIEGALQRLSALRHEAIELVAGRMTEELWERTRSAVVGEFVSKGSSPNNLSFVESLPPQASPLKDGGVSALSTELQRQCNELDWLESHAELFRNLLKKGDDDELSNAVFNSIQKCANANHQQNVAVLLRIARGTVSTVDRHEGRLNQAANRTPCPEIVDLVVEIEPDARPDAATNWLKSSWPTSGSFDEHALSANEISSRLKRDEIEVLIKAHPKNAKTRRTFEYLCDLDLESAVWLFASVPNPQKSAYAQRIWKNSSIDGLVETLGEHDKPQEVVEIVRAWDGRKASLSQLASLVEAHGREVASELVERLNRKRFEDADRQDRKSFVETLQEHLPGDPKVENLAVALDVKSVVKNNS